MKNKVLINLIVPVLDSTYSVYFPINKSVGNIIYLLNKAFSEIVNEEFLIKSCDSLFNCQTGVNYNLTQYIFQTDITNGTSLIFL